jgi:predicted histidine transporter YuiF (NhaC family)
VIGLLLFLIPFVSALRAARKLQRAGTLNGDLNVERLGRALLGAVIGIMVTIATVSSIDTIPTIYWIVIGLCVGTTRAFYSEAHSSVQPREDAQRYKNAYQIKADSAV